MAIEPSTGPPSISGRPPLISSVAGKAGQRAGQSALAGFRLTEPGGAVLADLKDVSILVYLVSGTWHMREAARDSGNGTYVIEFVPPKAGVYHVALECPSRGLSFDKSAGFDLRVYENR